MIWQDIVLSIGQWILAIALIPTIRGKEKPALSSSLITCSILVSFVVAFASLGLWVAATSTFLGSLAWITLAIQKILQMRGSDLASQTKNLR